MSDDAKAVTRRLFESLPPESELGMKLLFLLRAIREDPHLSPTLGLYWLDFNLLGVDPIKCAKLLNVRAHTLFGYLRSYKFTSIKTGAEGYEDIVLLGDIKKIFVYYHEHVHRNLDQTAVDILSADTQPVLSRGHPLRRTDNPRPGVIHPVTDNYGNRVLTYLYDAAAIDLSFSEYVAMFSNLDNHPPGIDNVIIYKLAVLCAFVGKYPQYGLKFGVSWIDIDDYNPILLFVINKIADAISCTTTEFSHAITMNSSIIKLQVERLIQFRNVAPQYFPEEQPRNPQWYPYYTSKQRISRAMRAFKLYGQLSKVVTD
jgi:hypothetical protein